MKTAHAAYVEYGIDFAISPVRGAFKSPCPPVRTFSVEFYSEKTPR